MIKVFVVYGGDGDDGSDGDDDDDGDGDDADGDIFKKNFPQALPSNTPSPTSPQLSYLR